MVAKREKTSAAAAVITILSYARRFVVFIYSCHKMSTKISPAKKTSTKPLALSDEGASKSISMVGGYQTDLYYSVALYPHKAD